MKFKISEYTIKELEDLTLDELTFAIDYTKSSKDPKRIVLKERIKHLRSIRVKKRQENLKKAHQKGLHLKDLDNFSKFKEGPKRNKKFWKKLKDSDRERYTQQVLDLAKKQKMKDKKKILKGPIHKPRL